jgi:hypothetical protein
MAATALGCSASKSKKKRRLEGHVIGREAGSITLRIIASTLVYSPSMQFFVFQQTDNNDVRSSN